MIDGRFEFGVVGGVGALAGADLLLKLMRGFSDAYDHSRYATVFEHQSFRGDRQPADSSYDATARKLHVYNLIRRLEERPVDAILLPCFISHTFIDEIAPNVGIPVVDLMHALLGSVLRWHPSSKKVGVLTSDFVRRAGSFDRTFGRDWSIVYPSVAQQAILMKAVYGEGGIKAAGPSETAAADIKAVCSQLLEEGCDVLLPGFTELSLIHSILGPMPLPDPNQAYVEFALSTPISRPAKPFKLGVVGGVGPLATADFMGKVVRLTSADRDQDHIKIIVEQNPQIPDRTDNLIHGGVDPTVALFATCKKLEAAQADLIAIPCNTAHAFVDRIQGHLRVPVLNMLDEAMSQIAYRQPGSAVGLMATAGTVKSGVYAQAALRAGVNLVLPDDEYQARVTGAIYGEHGVKAGFTDGRCREDLLSVIRHLVGRGATVVLLGCTELPLVFPREESLSVEGRSVALLDPTLLLAAACVRIAQATR